jgi:AraC family transcriptional activator of pobA
VMPGPARTSRRKTAIPVFTYVTEPGVPSVFVMRLDQQALRRWRPAPTHDFPGLVYFERSAGALTFRGRETPIHAGDAYLIGPNDVVDVVGDPESLVQARGSGVFFTPDALEAFSPVDSELAWRRHRLLHAFARENTDVVHRIQVPRGERQGWHQGIGLIERELRERGEGYREAVVAQLVLLLVSATRLAARQGGELYAGVTGT